MYYEIYIDVFFIINFVIDFISLSILKNVLHLNGRILKRVAAAFCASMLLCLYFIFDLRRLKFGLIIMLIITACGMLIISFKFKSVFGFVKSLVLFFVVNMCLNGFFNLIISKIGLSYQLIIAAVSAYVTFLLVCRLIRMFAKGQKEICEVVFVMGENRIKAKGIIDTGNCLISPYHNKGVSVVEYEIFEKYLSIYAKKSILTMFGDTTDEDLVDCTMRDYEDLDKTCEKIFAVPYKTISTKSAVMPVMAVDKMYINENGEEREYKAALIGFIREKVSSAGDYNVILSAKL